jgi:hypothetical protein
MWNTIYVVGDHAYRKRERLEACEEIDAEEAECVKCLGLPPRYIYRVECDEFEGLTADPIQVSRWRHQHPDAEVTVIPIV